MKNLIIPDWHHRWQIVKNIIDRHSDCDYIISLGDEFDGKGGNDTVEDARKTAEYLLECLNRPNFIWLAGNHTLPYVFPDNKYIGCMGNTPEKGKAIREVMGEAISRIQFYHYDGYFLYTHAGLNPRFLPKSGFSLEWFEERVKKVRCDAGKGTMNGWLGAGFSRGGSQSVGGITWQDWDDEFKPIEGVSQIVAHTKDDKPRRILAQGSLNICCDTGNRHYLIIEDGNVSIYESSSHHKWQFS
jgi:predicted phosphodiesterase